MSWTIIFLRDKINIEMPFSVAVEFIQPRAAQGKRFKIKRANDKMVTGSYSYRETLHDRLGYNTTFENEFHVMPNLADSSKTIVEFKIPTVRLIGYAILASFLAGLMFVVFPDVTVLWAIIILLTLYFGIVVSLNSQFHYFKSDIEQMEENFKKQVD